MTSAILTMFSHRPAVEEEYVRGDEIEAISLHGSTVGGEVNWRCKRGERAAREGEGDVFMGLFF